MEMTTERECEECGRFFDLMFAAQAQEWYYGHDCEGVA